MRRLLNIALVMTATVIASLATNSCGKKVEYTSILVQDSIRHYYPMIQGQELEIAYRIANIGKEPLVLIDIVPSCGCISTDGKINNIILPDKELTLQFRYNSSKSVGLVEEKIYLYGNIEPDGEAVLKFDVNVVAPYGKSPDYEEHYYEESKLERLIKGTTAGYEQERGYWIDSNEYPENYSRYYNKYPWRERKH
ncbi:MAG: DUF1573 domain-containing protein [Bacteroidales bacterium]|nr:DUF1573 domain-containing protein [Bacteroidales bacterium]